MARVWECDLGECCTCRRSGDLSATGKALPRGQGLSLCFEGSDRSQPWFVGALLIVTLTS